MSLYDSVRELVRPGLVDDRGQKKPSLPGRYFSCAPQAPSPLPLLVRNRVWLARHSRRLNVHTSRRQQVAVVLLIAMVIGAQFAAHAVLARLAGASPSLQAAARGAGAALAALPTIAMVWLVGMAAVRSSRTTVARRVAAEGFCGSCAYPLGEIEPVEDGCRVCPECGAAWKTRPAA